ncbi:MULTISPECIES: CIA30 family protein [unclassified Polaribacter]|uniref:CIA30 family protein n=1 Tax=unclassified Polaribacter TaxID=196858 RepID=UPI0011BEAEEC|nr:MULTISPECIES: CIA30 family protein [unclassified Polaribacter]TXD54345.1 CIA30 family protein [Polaribacter sp. IC063]TXD62824.1 CIA30 family protein [Polaribacter sp. IC066]
MNTPNHTIFDFSKDSNISSWKVVDDVVMGGRSQGTFKVNENGNGLFSGEVSLENNGGFSSLRYQFKEIKVASYTKVVLKVKGDGNPYQFRVKDSYRNFYSYIKTFNTSKEWELIEINLSEMYPAFRGRKLAMDNFSSEIIEEIAILIGNKKEQRFMLEIDEIYLE